MVDVDVDVRLACSRRAEVDLSLCPDYLSFCSKPISLSEVESKLGGPNDENREYLFHGEFIRDVRRIYSNSMAYNNPDNVTNELDRVRDRHTNRGCPVQCHFCPNGGNLADNDVGLHGSAESVSMSLRCKNCLLPRFHSGNHENVRTQSSTTS